MELVILTPQTNKTWKKLTFSAFQWYMGLGVADRVFISKNQSARKVLVVIFPVLRYWLSSDLQNYFQSRCTGLYVGLYAQHSATIKNTPQPWPTQWKSSQTKASLPSPLSLALHHSYICLAQPILQLQLPPPTHSRATG